MIICAFIVVILNGECSRCMINQTTYWLHCSLSGRVFHRHLFLLWHNLLDAVYDKFVILNYRYSPSDKALYSVRLSNFTSKSTHDYNKILAREVLGLISCIGIKLKTSWLQNRLLNLLSHAFCLFMLVLSKSVLSAFPISWSLPFINFSLKLKLNC